MLAIQIILSATLLILILKEGNAIANIIKDGTAVINTAALALEGRNVPASNINE